VRLKFAEVAKPTQTPTRVQTPEITQVEASVAEAREPDTKQAAASPRINAGFHAEFAESPGVETTHSTPISQSVRRGTSAYTPDPDPDRVRSRQWWKHDLYMRSGRKRADGRVEDRSGGAARSQ
jgi:hypothetical protein